jgi:hypothetical protein
VHLGEPTLMQLAIAEKKGLLVLDVKSKEHLVMPRIKMTTTRFIQNDSCNGMV